MSAQKRTTEVTFYRGRKFVRYPQSKYPSAHYFRPSRNDGDRRALHQVVWEDANGPVPDGFELHHRDKNKVNNALENLQLVPRGHAGVLHPENIAAAREAARIWHGSAEGLAWHSEHGAATWIGREGITKTCDHCGGEFSDINHRESNRFCSNKCKSAWRRAAGLDDEERICTICGARFHINRYESARTCSRQCAGKLQSRNRLANRESRAGL